MAPADKIAPEHIRRLQSPMSEIPIIGLTANVIQREKERALRIGMNDYLSEPIVFDDLKKAITTQLMSKFQLTETRAPFKVQLEGYPANCSQTGYFVSL